MSRTRLAPGAFLACLVLGASCTGGNPRPNEPDCLTHHVSLELGLDTAFSPTERDQITRAASDWTVWSGGKIQIVLSADDADDGRVIRLFSDSPETHDYDAKQQYRRKDPNYRVLGWYSSGNINLVVDRIGPENIALVAAHELGHAAGLSWPEPCADESRAFVIPGTGEHDCKHLANTWSLMSSAFTGNSFQPEDRDLCRASCLCP